MGIYDDLLPEEERKKRGIILNNANTGSSDGKYGIYSDLVTGKSPSQVASDQQKEQQGKKTSLIQKVKESVTNLFSKKKEAVDQVAPLTPMAGPAPSPMVIEPLRSTTPSLFDSIPAMPENVQADWSLKPKLFNSALESIKQSTISTIGSFGATAEMAGKMTRMLELTETGKWLQAKAQKTLENHPEWEADQKDQAWGSDKVVRLVAGAVPSLLGAFAATLTAGVPGVILYGFGAESGGAYKDAKNKGVSDQKATTAALTVGTINSLLESVFPTGKLGKQVIKETGKEISESLIKQYLKTAAKFGVNIAKDGTVEGTTEALQELTANVVAQSYDKNRKAWDNLLESFVGGFGSGAITGKAFERKDVPSNVMTPDQALTQVEGSDLKDTPAGIKITEVVAKAKEEGKNIQFNVTGAGEVSVVTPAGTKLGMDIIDAKVPEYVMTNQDGTIATPEVDNKSLPELKSAIDNYKSDQGVTIMPDKTVEVSPALKELSLLSERPDVVSITQNQVKAIPTNEDGTVTLYRVGTPRIGDNRLVSATYTKEAAVAFNEMHKKDMGDRPITEIKVKPEDIKVFVGGGEQEVLINNPHSSSIVSVTKVSDGQAPMVKVGPEDIAIPAADEPKIAEALRSSKGLSAEDIIKKHPDINLKRDVVITDIHGKKMTIDKGEALTPYEMKGGKVVLQDGQTYVVSKNQFQNVKGNALSGEAKEFAPELKQTEETVKGKPTTESDQKILDMGYDVAKDMDGSISITYKGEDVEFADLPVSVQELISQSMETNPVKYEKYVLPGGENYREILIKAPIKNSGITVKENTELQKLIMKSDRTPSETQRMNDLGKKADTADQIFRSSHWDERNVLAHIRLNERKYQDKPVTFIEEIQSDWAREARAKGIDITPERRNELDKRRLEIEALGKEATPAQKQEWVDIMNELKPENSSRVPGNELLKNWQEMAVKRSLLEAVSNKSEYMAWINGEQTSARYNLSTQIENVKWGADNSSAVRKEAGGKNVVIEPTDNKSSFNILIDKNGIITSSIVNEWTGKKLDEVIGKGLADKIMSDEQGTLSGDGLKFGGEWAVNLYDKQFKSIVEKLTGGKVETIDMELPVTKTSYKFRTNINANRMPTADLTVDNMEAGKVIYDESLGHMTITEVLGNGKFKAVDQNFYDSMKGRWLDMEGDQNWESRLTTAKTFDLSTSMSEGQQAIKLTPEIVAKIKGEAPKLKSPSGKDPFAKPVVPEPARIDRTKLVGRDLSKPNAVLLAERGIVASKEAPKLDKVALAAANKKLGDYYMKFGEDNPDALGQAWYEVMAEMEVAEPGQRIFDDYGEFKGSISSTFPDFVPEELRRTDLFNSVLDGVKDPTNMVYPPNSQPRKQALYDTILAEIDSRAGSDSSAIINEIKGIYEKANPKSEEVTSRSTTRSQPEQATTQKVNAPASETTANQDVPISRLQERIQEQLLEIDPNRYEFEEGSGKYNRLNLESDAQMAAYFIQNDPKQALDIALGYSDAPVGQTANAISLAVAFKARAEGNMELWKDIIIKTSLRNTKFGQEIVSLRGHFNNDTPENYIKKVLDARMDVLGKNLITDAQKIVGKKRSAKVNAVEKIDRETDKLVEKVNAPIKKKKVADRIKMAQDIIDSLICK